MHFLLDVDKKIRWGDSSCEAINIEIPRTVLGKYSPSRPDGKIEGGIHSSQKDLKIEKQGGFDILHLKGFSRSGIPGAPTLLEEQQYVALPHGAEVLGFEVIPGEAIHLPGPVNPYPVQPYNAVPENSLIRGIHYDSHNIPNAKFLSLKSLLRRD